MPVSITRESAHIAIHRQEGMMRRLKSYLSRSRAERQLFQLDDRLLADIGVNRGDISRSVWGA